MTTYPTGTRALARFMAEYTRQKYASNDQPQTTPLSGPAPSHRDRSATAPAASGRTPGPIAGVDPQGGEV